MQHQRPLAPDGLLLGSGSSVPSPDLCRDLLSEVKADSVDLLAFCSNVLLCRPLTASITQNIGRQFGFAMPKMQLLKRITSVDDTS